ncbi:MAG: hypothetical protein V4580_17440 [Bacteroidota bacterium]
MKTPLKVIIDGDKELNSLIKQTLLIFLPALCAFAGKKICKADSTLVKAADSLKDLIVKDARGYAIGYITFEYGYMYINFKICKSGGSYDVTPSTAYTQYFERRVEVGTFKGDQLTGVAILDYIVKQYNLDKDIDLDAEVAKIETLKAMQKELDKFKDTIDYTVREYYR